MIRLQRRLIHALYKRSIRSNWNSYVLAAENPQRSQEQVLMKILKRNRNSEYGQRFCFDRVSNPQAFQAQLPVVDYESLRPEIQRMVQGQNSVLTSSKIKIFEKTSGSSGANKLIPYTAELLGEFSTAISPWLYDMFSHYPSLLGRGSYWSISHVVGSREKTPSGISIGFEDDTEYMGPLTRWAWSVLNTVPSSVARVPSLDEWKWRTALALLSDKDLGMISIWSPTFALRLMDFIGDLLPQALKSLPKKRSFEIETALDKHGVANSVAFWPGLKMISTWADGPSKMFIPELQNAFPQATIQPKGILATEGVLSFPVHGCEGSVLAIESHFLEFIDVNRPQRGLFLAHELEKNGLYSPVLTTSGGLYRYHLKDVIRCVGYFKNTPLIRFEQKYDKISDLCGEKLNAFFVQECVQRVCKKFHLNPRFAMLAPVHSVVPSYCLYLESPEVVNWSEVASSLDHELCQAHHFSYARRLSQLGGTTIKRVTNGYEKYEDHLTRQGMIQGNIKPTFLDANHAWEEVFKNA